MTEKVPPANIRKNPWNDFRKSGMLWFINRILHVFGWAIVLEYSDAASFEDADSIEPQSVYPARVTYRGFDLGVEDTGFKNVTEYMVKNAKRLKDEVDSE